MAHEAEEAHAPTWLRPGGVVTASSGRLAASDAGCALGAEQGILGPGGSRLAIALFCAAASLV